MQDALGRRTRAFVWLLLLAVAAPGYAQQLAIRHFRVADGLAHGVVISLHQEAKGYLWLATYEGVSRFDGYQFTNYSPRDGLEHVVVNDLTSDRRGRIWAAVNGAGVARLLDPPDEQRAAGGRKFTTVRIDRDQRHPANAVNRILFDAQDRLWCVTDAGLYRAPGVDVRDGEFERVVPGAVPYFNNAALADRRGRLWFGVGSQVIEVADGAVRVSSPGRETAASAAPLPPSRDIHAIVEDRAGRI